ncbi:YbgA family protein [Desulfopila aestuarii]|uniref:Uncharacterized conserved protein YbbK, DUF523 family n=1 Tax=Desulfopila aestuarii DSM 18488 TaxID=1121416 RepID=A0A1M7Y9D8_9BACT|nr:DUF523 and DUF1722 domain-containing protein [Desulfopila aestuarii]SHO49252.1 Uncharacterized conserved protein YbbK, DUF523 family [Desulfopila aestuarii DSM 18488]
MDEKIRLGISSCLLGNPVRFDGGHKHDRFLTDTLGRYADYIPVCPEVECGMPIPREALRLVGTPEAPRLVTSRTNIDHTEQMQQWAEKRLRLLAEEQLDGFIFKSRSPSSGMERVKVYTNKGMPEKNGIGIFARAFMERFPNLPVEEEGRLHDPILRENFIERIFVHRRWRRLLAEKRTVGALVQFHTSHKLLLFSHSEKIYRDLGRLVAQARKIPDYELFTQYEQQLMAALKLRCTLKKHTNVLMHILGYFKKMLTSDEKQELLTIIDNFKEGLIPLIVPVTLINHYVRKYNEEYLADQYYLNPHPLELKLRNHA